MALLENRVAIITGSGRPKGMGRAAALRFAAEGAKVVITDLIRESHRKEDLESLERVAKEVQLAGADVLHFGVDVTDRSQVADCVSNVIDAFGTVDVLVNNAGTAVGAGPFLEQTDDQWDISFKVHLMGTTNCCREVIPIMQAAGGGSIVNNSSMLGLAAESFSAAYTATKFGIVGLTKVIAAEFGKNNIRCNAVCPGSVDTAMQSAGIKQFAEWHGVSEEQALADAERNALGRSAKPEEVADVMLWLASSMSSFVSGAAIPVSGAANPGV